MAPHKKTKYTAFLWHRRVGLVALILIIILAVTGIMLNHTEGMQLDERYVESSWVLDWYGLNPDGEAVSYSTGEHTVSQWGDHIFFDNQTITTSTQTLHGAIRSERFLVAAFDDELLLLSDEGELIERMPTRASFSGIKRIGVKYNRSVIETHEPVYYIADEHILDWDVTNHEGIEWSQPVKLEKSQQQKMLESFRGKGLNMERVMLDLHSGRFFGEYGIYIMDAAAVALLWLSLSGVWQWRQRREKEKQKRHYQKHHRV